MVYLAEQREPVRRRVALKLVKLGMDSAAVLQRFDLERQALAVMNHDNIARVFDVGTSEHGQPYFVMEHVPGLPITEYCDRHRLSLEERLGLFRDVCAGVQHAHQKGVIHRDLKPGNVLVTEEQGRAVAKIIDFGIARATDHVMVAATLFTEIGQVMGTPEYMSPEQADPTVADIDTRTDVYSLGVLLYQLLVGALPFSRQELQEQGFAEMQRRILEVEPPRPSTALTTQGEGGAETARHRRTTPAALVRALRSDLDWVVLKAMEKDRNRRYASAAELAADLGRFLAHEPLEAGPPSAAYRLRKLVRRYRVHAIAVGAVAVAVIAGLLGTAWFAIEADRSARTLRVRTSQFDLLALVVALEDVVEREAGLYPAWPETGPAMEAWLGDLRAMSHARPRVRVAVAALRDAEGGGTGADRFLVGALERWEGDLTAWRSPRPRACATGCNGPSASTTCRSHATRIAGERRGGRCGEPTGTVPARCTRSIRSTSRRSEAWCRSARTR